jgi:hypothetical protein
LLTQVLPLLAADSSGVIADTIAGLHLAQASADVGLEAAVLHAWSLADAVADAVAGPVTGAVAQAA